MTPDRRTRAVRGRSGGRAPWRVLALGAELKCTFCCAERGGSPRISEPFGDLKDPTVFRRYVRAIDIACAEFCPDVIACDLHPAYLSTRHAEKLARDWSRPLLRVQHHHAHVLSLLAERGEESRVVGVVCDGVGFGADGHAWGGEILLCTPTTFYRGGHLREFPLLGGDMAAIQTWRPAVGLLAQTLGAGWHEWLVAQAPSCAARLARAGVDVPFVQVQLAQREALMQTSSAGRVFDAAAFLVGLCDENRREAQAAIALETAAEREPDVVEPFAYAVGETGRGTESAELESLAIDLGPMAVEIVQAATRGVSVATIAARFHETLARALAEATGAVAARHDIRVAALTGGALVNRRLCGRLTALLENAGLRVLTHRAVSPGDSGIALGQAWAALHWSAEAMTGGAARERGAASAALAGG